jgi:hypothetical protein
MQSYFSVTFKRYLEAGGVAQVVEHLPSKCEAEFKPHYQQEKKMVYDNDKK